MHTAPNISRLPCELSLVSFYIWRLALDTQTVSGRTKILSQATWPRACNAVLQDVSPANLTPSCCDESLIRGGDWTSIDPEVRAMCHSPNQIIFRSWGLGGRQPSWGHQITHSALFLLLIQQKIPQHSSSAEISFHHLKIIPLTGTEHLKHLQKQTRSTSWCRERKQFLNTHPTSPLGVAFGL